MPLKISRRLQICVLRGLTGMKLSIFYPSKTVNKCLPPEYEALGKALIYGTPQRIANAVVKSKSLTKHVVHSVLRLLSNEVCGLCSRSNPSLLRKCDKESLVNFSFQSVCEEWKSRAPIFYADVGNTRAEIMRAASCELRAANKR